MKNIDYQTREKQSSCLNELSFKLPKSLVLYKSSLILNTWLHLQLFQNIKKTWKISHLALFISMKRYRRPELEKSSSSESDPDEPLYVPLKERRKAQFEFYHCYSVCRKITRESEVNSGSFFLEYFFTEGLWSQPFDEISINVFLHRT